MSRERDADAFIHESFKQFTDALADGKLFPSLLSPEIVGPMLEIQRAMMNRMLDVLVEPASGEASDKRKKDLTKALMTCSLDMIKATREYREHVLGAQSKLIERYLETLAEASSPPSQADAKHTEEHAGSDAEPAKPRD